MPKMIVALLVCIAGPIFAQAPDLYSGEVRVRDQSATTRAAALPEALRHVLRKQSGQRELPANPDLDDALSQAETLLLSFHYLDRKRTMTDGETESDTWLVASFLPDGVDRILRRLGLPQWRRDRETLTVWPIVDEGYGRELMPVEYAYAWDALREAAHDRGLPMALPTDAEMGQAGVDLSLLWGGFTEGLAPGDGQGGQAVIAARRSGAQWQLRWVLDSGSETFSWRMTDVDLTTALTEGLHRLVDVVASRRAFSAGELGAWTYRLTVGGLASAAAYARCVEYLRDLGLVDGVRVEAAEAGRVVFDLALNAEPRYLRDMLRQDRVLQSGGVSNEYYLVP